MKNFTPINIWSWLKRLFKRPENFQSRHSRWPTKDQIALLPPFESVGPKNIVIVDTAESAQRAHEELMREEVVGFDTESKPTFVKGQVSTGPHVAQFAARHRTYVFLLHNHETREAACSLIACEMVKKVGFGLREDLRRIPIKLKVQPRATVDLESLFSERGYGRGVGVKVAVAIALKRRFAKSKSASTSNWMNRRLSHQQVLYAANDAYAALCVHNVLARDSRRPKK